MGGFLLRSLLFLLAFHGYVSPVPTAGLARPGLWTLERYDSFLENSCLGPLLNMFALASRAFEFSSFVGAPGVLFRRQVPVFLPDSFHGVIRPFFSGVNTPSSSVVYWPCLATLQCNLPKGVIIASANDVP